MPRSSYYIFPSYGSESCGSSPVSWPIAFAILPSSTESPIAKGLPRWLLPPLDRRGASCLTGAVFIPVLFFHLSCPHCLSRLYTVQLLVSSSSRIQSGYPLKAPPRLIRTLVFISSKIARKCDNQHSTLPGWDSKRSRKLKRRFLTANCSTYVILSGRLTDPSIFPNLLRIGSILSSSAL